MGPTCLVLFSLLSATRFVNSAPEYFKSFDVRAAQSLDGQALGVPTDVGLPKWTPETRTGADDLARKENHNAVVVEGDILLESSRGVSAAQRAEEWKTGVGSSQRWYAGRIPYVIDSAFGSSDRTKISQAITYWNANADAARFIPRTTHTNYVRFTPGDGSKCYAYFGNQGKGAHDLFLGNGCLSHSTIVHEMMHSAGFRHEQTRTDRDSFVEVLYSNIKPSEKYNYDTVANTETFGLPYDIKSVTHYKGYEFALSSGLKTIKPRPPNQNQALGSNHGFSATDKLRLNAMYPLCATGYYDKNQKGTSWTFGKNDEANLQQDTYDKMSSAVVKKGCKLTICKLADFQGGCHNLNDNNLGTGDNWHNDFATLAGSWDNEARSYKCTC